MQLTAATSYLAKSSSGYFFCFWLTLAFFYRAVCDVLYQGNAMLSPCPLLAFPNLSACCFSTRQALGGDSVEPARPSSLSRLTCLSHPKSREAALMLFKHTIYLIEHGLNKKSIKLGPGGLGFLWAAAFCCHCGHSF